MITHDRNYFENEAAQTWTLTGLEDAHFSQASILSKFVSRVKGVTGLQLAPMQQPPPALPTYRNPV
jgi:hypothetical protein